MRVLVTFAAVLLLLAGCTPEPIVETAAPSPSPTPVFASEEEALAAAEEAYVAYVELADLVFMEGGKDPERLAAVATGSFLSATVEGFKEIQQEGWFSTGGTVVRDFSLQVYYDTAVEEMLIAYVCEDISAVDVLDASGNSVVSPDRPDTALLQVVFDLSEKRELLVSSREAWSDEPC